MNTTDPNRMAEAHYHRQTCGQGALEGFAAGVLAEREACAKVAETMRTRGGNQAQTIAAAIRARSAPTLCGARMGGARVCVHRPPCPAHGSGEG